MLNTGRPNPSGYFDKFKSHYLDIPNAPLYPFGYGLSYTTFEYGPVVVSDTLLSPDEEITASVRVTNKGDRAGKEVVQMYIRDVVGSISRPVKELKGFQKISLAPGESKTVTFNIHSDLLKFFNGKQWLAEAGTFQVFMGPNSRDNTGVPFKYR
jgi:beta-glucosidase